MPKNTFRLQVEEMIEKQDALGLLKKAGEMHGHLCNYLAYGVMAGLYGIRKLGVNNTGMEEIIAVVETNNCFADGVQMVTGCTLGNNALIYRDYGKTGVTLSTRDGRAVRLVLKPEFDDTREKEYPEAYALFNRLVARREQGAPEDYGKMMRLFAEMSVAELGVPAEKMFVISEKTAALPAYAPIFETVKCQSCGENVMKTRSVKKDDGVYCIPCAQEEYYELNGGGIVRRS